MSTAKKIRLGRLLNKETRKSLIVPIDHGLTVGPLKGLESSGQISRWIDDPNIDAVIAHKGMIERLVDRGLLQRKGIILHLNGMNTLAENPDDKATLSNLQSALRLGVDGVSLQVNFTGRNDRDNWKMLGAAGDEAAAHGLPLLCMLYDKVPASNETTQAARLRQLMRVAVELGSDAIKISLGQANAEIYEVIQSLSEDVLVFVAGGELTEEQKLLSQVTQAMHHGASGLCMGRNIFERKNPALFLKTLAELVHRKGSDLRREDKLHAV